MENNSSASERWLLRGAPNARDLGGLPTMDGRTIRPGLLLRSGELDLRLARAEGSVSYFAPCHQRQQGIGRPWMDLLGLLPDIRLEKVGDGFDCCGQGGIMGFKKEFHESSLKIGSRLFDKIGTAAPGRLVTDCLSCRIQFQQVLPFDVAHPVELLWEGYRGFRPVASEMAAPIVGSAVA